MVYKILANTVFLGKNIVYVPECHSTNALASSFGHNPTTHEGTIVITDRQTQGRGQRGNAWLTEPGANFTFSIILKPAFLQVSRQFYLNVVVSLGIAYYLEQHVNGVSIKWPNDIMIGDKKVCGTLIENQVQKDCIAASVVGIGLNMNQAKFEFSHATSLYMITGKSFELATELEKLISAIESNYLLLKQDHFVLLREKYMAKLYWRDEEREFRIKGEIRKGRITGVNEQGSLEVVMSGVVGHFDFKEIEFVG